ncbi:polysaccharide biosynthesis/export family protein [Calothrix rhizosoleniae]|uniref:polysaccharide biosynthesis/export family protein n=1 Tax=Calothrix rhizosoleniae TaxID=888997 RepID=UPI000B498D9C|nr:polysaccharide biosynthesis/export family protein [Calothrix rhizosoleniae]
MLNTGLLKFLTQPIAGVVVLMTMMFFPSASLAQINTVSTDVQLNTLTGTQTQNALDRNYTLGGGDRIRVNVFEVPEYTGEYQIPPGGRINLPLIGSIPLEGLTTEEAADNIAKQYSRYLKRPLISVNLLSPRPINVFVSGEITRPGSYTLSLQGSGGDNPGVQYPTVLAALTAAQGVTMTADITQVVVRRRGRGGEQKAVPLNLKEWVTTGQVPQDITLRDGDTIFVPTAKEPSLAEARNLAALNFAASPSAPRTVAVIGEVNRPGAYLVSTNNTANNNQQNQPGGGNNVANLPTLTRVIQQAGGITSQANVRKVTIRRPTKNKDGYQQNIDINLWQLLQSGDISQDVILQDGDTIVVPTATEINPAEATQLATTTLSPAEIEVGVVGEVKTPGRVRIKPNSPLNDALLAAGGFNDARAKKKKVTLVRLNPNGSVTKRQIKVDLASGINEQTNPILRDDDVVLVGRSGIAKVSDPLGLILGPVGGAINVLRFFFGF